MESTKRNQTNMRFLNSDLKGGKEKQEKKKKEEEEKEQKNKNKDKKGRVVSGETTL